MRSFMKVCAVLAVSVLCSGVMATLNPIVVKGNAFFDSVTNQRFYIRGVDYQVSPLSMNTYEAWWIFCCQLRSFSVGYCYCDELMAGMLRIVN
jgi:hypothetical protein